MASRTAEATWQGTLKEGRGSLKLGSGAYDGPFSYTSRFEEGINGTNPEELIGAAEAGCFTMALGAALERAGFPVEHLHTTAKVHLTREEAGLTISKIELETTGRVPNVDEATFQQHVESTRTGCIVARALTAEIVVRATLMA